MILCRIALLLSLSFYSLSATAQNASVDTIEVARQLAYQKKFSEADKLLNIYNSRNQNVYASWLHAQVFYWMKDTERAERLYESLLKKYPEVSGIKFSFGKMLWETGKFRQARIQLENCLLSEPRNVEADMLLVYLDYWNGNAAKAKSRVEQILQREPKNTEAQKLQAEINHFSAPSVSMELNNLSDDQVLKSNTVRLRTSWIQSGAFSPSINFYGSHFSIGTKNDSEIKTAGVQVGNTFRLNYGKTVFSAEGGVFQSDSGTSFTGALRLVQKLPANLFLDLDASQQPYQYTLASVQTPFTFRTAGAAVGFNKNEKWIAKAGGLVQAFNDGNKITTVYGWMLIPLLSHGGFMLQGGYSFSHANADQNTYVPQQSNDVIVASYKHNDPIAGVYKPYFTPQQQTVHALLASVKTNFSKNVSLRVKGSYGLLAEAQNPNLTLGKAGNSFFISKTYNLQQYTPVELEGNLELVLPSKIALKATYTYSSLFFYTRHLANLGLSYHFIK